MPTTIREIQYGSDEYRQVIRLRFEVLRKPLGLAFSEKQLAKEADDIHIAAFDGAELAGCIILTPYNNGKIKMRQAAVLPQKQRQGIGRLLTEFAEQAARKRGFSEIILHARENAVQFYEKSGYQVTGESFIEITLSHRAMSKFIA
ncbi:GNAT family N-acetyltransferase [Ignavibacteria bacterium]|jgi:ribosomal protein S18 acetylase RimI-like enzyme|nr:GNAT family N-acetyltransferase [Bacteroidota bacterium]MCZ2133077.1 GNAT family N-acetyltransferase [Bacteroidota bacterium]